MNGGIAVSNAERFHAMWNGRPVCCVHQVTDINKSTSVNDNSIFETTSYPMDRTNVIAQPLLSAKFSDKITIKGFALLFVVIVCTGGRGRRGGDEDERVGRGRGGEGGGGGGGGGVEGVRVGQFFFLAPSVDALKILLCVCVSVSVGGEKEGEYTWPNHVACG